MKRNIVKIGALLCVITIILALTGCGGSRSDIGYDENGFLGYSDDFWEWYADNN